MFHRERQRMRVSVCLSRELLSPAPFHAPLAACHPRLVLLRSEAGNTCLSFSAVVQSGIAQAGHNHDISA